MAHQNFNELNDMQMETISGGHHCHGRQHHHNRWGGGGGGGLMGQIRAALAGAGSNSNISIIIISNSTINAPLTINVTQGIRRT